MKYHGGLTSVPIIGAYLPQEVDPGPCKECSAPTRRVWRGSAFQQRTECPQCGRVTNWVMCGHDAVAMSDDDSPRITREEDARG